MSLTGFFGGLQRTAVLTDLIRVGPHEFGAPQAIDLAALAIASLDAADLDRDGDIDVLAASAGTDTVGR